MGDEVYIFIILKKFYHAYLVIAKCSHSLLLPFLILAFGQRCDASEYGIAAGVFSESIPDCDGVGAAGRFIQTFAH